MYSTTDPLYKKVLFYTVKLPFIYIAIPTGFIFEYLITLPFILLCAFDSISQNKKRGRTSPRTHKR